MRAFNMVWNHENSTLFNCFKLQQIKSTNGTDLQSNLFNLKAFSINSTIVWPDQTFPEPLGQGNVNVLDS